MAKTLDDALAEFDRWGEQLSKKLEHMTPEEELIYLNGAEARLEKLTGVKLKLEHVPAPTPASTE
jgi:hypothetical protein